MKVTRKSVFTGIERTWDLPITEEQWEKYQSGAYLIQDIFYNLSDDEREFIMTGSTPDEWDTYMRNPEDE